MLLRANSEGARQELVRSGAIKLVVKLFFEYVFPFSFPLFVSSFTHNGMLEEKELWSLVLIIV